MYNSKYKWFDKCIKLHKNIFDAKIFQNERSILSYQYFIWKWYFIKLRKIYSQSLETKIMITWKSRGFSWLYPKVHCLCVWFAFNFCREVSPTAFKSTRQRYRFWHQILDNWLFNISIIILFILFMISFSFFTITL